MKKVVLSKPETIVDIKNVSEDKYYGVHQVDSNDKGFICRESYNKGLYQARALDKLTIGNTWFYGRTSVADAVRQCVESNYLEVFEFETSKELAIWLAAD